ncbi:MAG: methyltransferase regulatory domain-containing protein [Dechloromonas sp.]|uniref:Methyltransferase regulatory domain-containing protein n=1 Tax=Candidatus Dechloromonas phosphorivorans TaxID=2899244 RepID=A0A935KBJ2_9RHOO|nr:methyltransferase regulatory domain-containing protein [Candidatus Dechloromonas phosphorivorans]
MESAPTQAPNYLAQEYLNEAWYPLYVTDVMRELAPAKLEYVASATLGDNDLRFLVSDDLASLIRVLPIPCAWPWKPRPSFVLAIRLSGLMQSKVLGKK